MKVLFTAFRYNDDAQSRIKQGILDDADVDYVKDVVLDKLIIDTDHVVVATPDGDKDERTIINMSVDQCYILKYTFLDYVRLTNPLSSKNFAARINT